MDDIPASGTNARGQRTFADDDIVDRVVGRTGDAGGMGPFHFLAQQVQGGPAALHDVRLGDIGVQRLLGLVEHSIEREHQHREQADRDQQLKEREPGPMPPP